MAENDQIAGSPPEDNTPNSVMDEETRLRPEFVDKVLDAVDAGDDETARTLVRPAPPGRRRRPDRARRAATSARAW